MDSKSCENCDCYKLPAIDQRLNLANSVKLHHYHLLVCSNQDPSKWPKKVEFEHPILKNITKQTVLYGMKNKKLPIIVKSTLCHGFRDSSIDDPSKDTHDIFIFPQGWYFPNFKNSDVNSLVLDLYAHQSSSNHSPTQLNFKNAYDFASDYYFVCTHNSRDYRCGTLGVEILNKFKKSIPKTAAVLSTSHIGGHKYSGNVIHYPSASWFGYIDSKMVPEVLKLVQGRKIPFTDEDISNLKIQDIYRGTAVRMKALDSVPSSIVSNKESPLSKTDVD